MGRGRSNCLLERVGGGDAPLPGGSCPAAAKGHELAFAPLLAKKRRGPGTASAPAPCRLPGGGRAPAGGQRLFGGAGSPGRFAAETLSRPAPVPPAPREGSEGEEGLRRFSGEQRPRSGCGG